MGFPAFKLFWDLITKPRHTALSSTAAVDNDHLLVHSGGYPLCFSSDHRWVWCCSQTGGVKHQRTPLPQAPFRLPTSIASTWNLFLISWYCILVLALTLTTSHSYSSAAPWCKPKMFHSFHTKTGTLKTCMFLQVKVKKHFVLASQLKWAKQSV